MMQLSFFGATGTVTGSKYMVTKGNTRVLVDCGLFQGIKQNRVRNWEDPPFDPSALSAVVLTHAHIDHSGYLPVLVKRGFSGPVYCTQATRELCNILLPDSGYLQEEEARFRNKHKTTKHSPALPLYTQAEAERSLKSIKAVPFDSEVELGDKLRFTFTPVGHILGSACVHLNDGNKTILFSGDVGRPEAPVMRAPRPVDRTDYMVVESTYGNRLHEEEDPKAQLAAVINRTVERDGTVVIPSFAVGRAQTILHLIAELRAEGGIPDVPVFLNSPMAINATEIYCAHHTEHRLTAEECRDIFAVADFVRSPEASKALNTNAGPAVIISASGMASGGRVLHHLHTLLPDSRNTVLFAGFQAPGTRGAALTNGAEEVKIHGELVPVRAEVIELDNLSAHADYEEIIAWLRHMKESPRRTFITHGQPDAAEAFQQHLSEDLNWDSEIPEYLDEVKLG
jgi:metallo-beta-lactamase family protein